MDTPGGMQDVAVINESGLYALTFASKLPTARQFKRWVTLPSIRKHGAYATPATIDRIAIDPEFGIRLLDELKTERERSAGTTTGRGKTEGRLLRHGVGKPLAGKDIGRCKEPGLLRCEVQPSLKGAGSPVQAGRYLAAVSEATRKPKRNNFKRNRRGCSTTIPAICGFWGLQNRTSIIFLLDRNSKYTLYKRSKIAYS